MSNSISTAIGLERLARTNGYAIRKGFFDLESNNLPQQIVILGEANTANQNSLSVAKTEITSAWDAGVRFGFGSPIHQMTRILRPNGGDGVGGIPTIVMPQITAGGATATVIVWTVTGTATANATHKLFINGRDNMDGTPYTYAVAIGDTPTVIAGKIIAAVNAVLATPVIVTNTAGVVTFTTKWKGASSANTNITVSNNNVPAGVTYAQTGNTAGAGAVDLAPSLAQFEDNWFTTVINPYGADALDALENFNGVPDDLAPTGRYSGRIFKPFMAFFGSTLSSVSALTAITDAAARINQVTNVICPAPGSAGAPWEAAANVVALFAPVMQNTPELDISGLSFPDMPVPATIGEMGEYNNRDLLLKAGCSTVTLSAGAYVVEDLVTTYHPAGELPLQYNYCRNLNLDWEVKDGYTVLEKIKVIGKVLVPDDQASDSVNIIKPKDWKAELYGYFDELADRALIHNVDFSKAGLRVQISTANPNRFETRFPYKRTGLARITSTDVVAGF